jgi:prepilin-type N-terminal cleavage/methylation domain-containing protein
VSIRRNMKRARLINRARKNIRRSSGGFTLIEVLIALALFGIIAITFAGGLSTSSKAALTADVRTNAESLARTQMEYVKSQSYNPAPDGGTANYIKIDTTRFPGYTICSANGTGPPVNCDQSDPIIGIPWDSGNNTAVYEDNGLQKIKLVITHDGREVITLEDYKVDR